MVNSRVMKHARRELGLGVVLLLVAMVGVLCSAGVARAATIPTFHVAEHIAGLGPTWVEGIDVTGDGELDLVVANGDDDSVTVSAGDGAGNFAPAVAFPTGGDNPYALDVAELTGDRHLDIAVANRSSHTVTILEGDGTGGFALVHTKVTGIEVIDVKALDLDDDGDLDLVSTAMWTPSYLDGTLYLLYNNGAGRFTRVDLPLPYSGCTVMGVGDPNEDGHPDVAVGHSAHTKESLLLNDGLGYRLDGTGWPVSNLVRSSELEVGPYPQGAVFADFDDDGHQDLCVNSRYPNNANIFLGDGTGAFTGPTSYAVGPYPKVPVAADLNGDGALDIAVCNYGNDSNVNTTISILTGRGDGTFDPQSTVTVGGKPHSVAVADFNGDGWPDLAVPNWASSDVSVLINTTPYASDDTDPVTTSSADTAWHQDPVTVTLTATDAGSGVAETKYRIDGGAWQTYTAGFSISAEGDHTVQFYSVDRVGNQESTHTAHVKIDMSAPVTSSSADSAWHKAPVTVTLTPTDAVGEVAQTTYRVDGGAWQTGTSFGVGADGDHTIQFYSEDAAGNVESANTAHVKVDATLPEVTLTMPLADTKYAQGGGVACAWTSSDATSGVASEVARIDGVAVAEGAPIDAVAEGEHTFSLTVTDVAGNARTVTVDYLVAVPDPTSLTPASLAAAVTWGSGTTLSATLTDIGSGAPVGGQQVRLESSPNQIDWTLVKSVTSDPVTGVCRASVAPKTRTFYRFAYLGDAELEHAATASGAITVSVRPAVGTPKGPLSVRAGARFSVTGTLKPRFPSGSKTVRVQIYRLKAGKWALVKTSSAVNSNSGSYSKYTLKLRLSVKAKYRFKATTRTTAVWAATTTGFSRTLVVK